MRTPWGQAQSVDHLAPGIEFVTTASHGGVKLSEDLNRKIPAYMRQAGGWYEEDVDWAVVATIFPEAFPEKERISAKSTLRNWRPDAYERFYAEEIQAGQSFIKDDRLFQERHKDDYIVLAGWGDWHPQVPEGFVGVFAGRGGRLPTGGYPEDTAYFLVPASEYQSILRERHFIVDLDRHERVSEIK